MPANWVETSLSESRKFIDIKFTSSEEEGMSIIFGSYDAWEDMAESEREVYSRYDIDNDIFAEPDIADMVEMYGTSIGISNISTVKYGGTDYFKTTFTNTSTKGNVNLTITMTQLMTINNGYVYYFQFSGTSDNKYYKDYETLLSSVKYEGQDMKEISKMNNSLLAGNSNSNLVSNSNIWHVLFSLILTIIVYSLPIIIYRYVVRKENIERRKAKKITIIYGIFAFVFMTLLKVAINGESTSSGAIILWSYVNYRMLVVGQKKYTEPTLHKDLYANTVDFQYVRMRKSIYVPFVAHHTIYHVMKDMKDVQIYVNQRLLVRKSL